jgi:hypothetical protein
MQGRTSPAAARIAARWIVLVAAAPWSCAPAAPRPDVPTPATPAAGASSADLETLADACRAGDAASCVDAGRLYEADGLGGEAEDVYAFACEAGDARGCCGEQVVV